MFFAFSAFSTKARVVAFWGVASNGLIQGCPLTLVEAMATVWAMFVRASTPEATLAMVIDARRMFVSGPQSREYFCGHWNSERS